ncbi:MAG: cytochrome C biogenesis protein [Pseudomonadota bacterium]
MIWVFLLVTTLLIGLALWRFAKMPRVMLEIAAAALLLGIAGYAWQGSPSQPGNPVESAASTPPPTDISAALRKATLSKFGAEGEILAYADAYIKSGHSQAAVSAVRAGLLKSPNNADLWVGLGNALVVHSDGQMSPAAQFAFEKAAMLAPNHPGPPFFLGLGLAQAGKFDDAGQVWRGLLARAPDDAPWRADLESRLAEIGQTQVAKSSEVKKP